MTTSGGGGYLSLTGTNWTATSSLALQQFCTTSLTGTRHNAQREKSWCTVGAWSNRYFTMSYAGGVSGWSREYMKVMDTVSG